MRILKIINSKLKAFTIIELLITLMLSSLIISIAFVTFGKLQQYFINYQSVKNEVYETERLYSNIQSDLFNCNYIVRDESIVSFISDNKTIKYSFGRDFIVNSTLLNDSIKVRIIDIQAFYRNNYITEGIIDELNICILLHKDSVDLHFYKEYTISNLLFIEKGMTL